MLGGTMRQTTCTAKFDISSKERCLCTGVKLRAVSAGLKGMHCLLV